MAVQQVDVRLEQSCALAQQFPVLKNRGHHINAYFSAQYISFFNCTWLILNDIILGLAVGAFICDNHRPIAELLLWRTKQIAISHVESSLSWLDNWPAGLKLNTELSSFYRFTFTGLLAVSDSVIDHLAHHLPTVVFIIGAAGPLGLTMILSLLSDLLSLITFHLYLSYLLATTIFRHQLVTARSLFNLFRGRRRNVLRHRTDWWDYDIDQLLLGTMVFTLVSFLFPTVVVYYALFALSRLVIILIHAALETALAFMNHFPLFALTVRMKDPWRLPGTVAIFVIVQHIPDNAPLPFSNIFFQYLVLWSRLSAHYSPVRLLGSVVRGKYLTPIPRYSIRYRIYPDRRS
ncbi:Gpi1-domain-containing protein [Rickenella mellea]|uniref:Gpi1-domain-containing protein n=1 Tax=Rickenella mellea TaxID=50990 RepID=A0A4R5XE35_9AGAM|nr:Gpi1-domain-containing protein [Rickenella mellea]